MGGVLKWLGVRGDPDTTTVFGIEFARGEPTTVDDNEKFRRLSLNPMFEVVSGKTVTEKDTKAKLQDQLEAMGVTVDGRWSVDRLQQELAKVKGEGQ